MSSDKCGWSPAQGRQALAEAPPQHCPLTVVKHPHTATGKGREVAMAPGPWGRAGLCDSRGSRGGAVQGHGNWWRGTELGLPLSTCRSAGAEKEQIQGERFPVTGDRTTNGAHAGLLPPWGAELGWLHAFKGKKQSAGALPHDAPEHPTFPSEQGAVWWCTAAPGNRPPPPTEGGLLQSLHHRLVTPSTLPDPAAGGEAPGSPPRAARLLLPAWAP